ncbi:MAG: type II toxin-antitoxin system RelE/ParE family toxin [Bacteroidetes bacterium]|nr:type II toxin-antitoxin system RelE/ParE family toxin [Bacteroidota bacterium]MCL5267639.1 type II toxin-antitoxin system RelE/ParE family toxin [Bacteroidota bacterium]
MIRSFKDREAQKIFDQERSATLPYEIQDRALRKLIILNAAETERDLTSPPSNHFEHLAGKRKGECSIRINDRWRICFKLVNGDAYDVGIEDYH